MTYQWEDFPDLDDVRAALQRQAELKSRVKAAKLTLEIYQAELSQLRPRETAIRLIGIDAESKQRLTDLMQEVVDAECELDKIDADVKFNSHRIEIAKAWSYKGRI